jgi:hypothetical protein
MIGDVPLRLGATDPPDQPLWMGLGERAFLEVKRCRRQQDADMVQYTARRLEIDLVKRFMLRLDELREQFAGSAAIYSSCPRQP